MNENLNLYEILKDCPKGTKLYSPICGKVEFIEIRNNLAYRIMCMYRDDAFIMFNERGQCLEGGECMLFPSKDVRTWDNFKPKKPKFDPKTLQPFDRILVRDLKEDTLVCGLFSCFMFDKIWTTGRWRYGIPYNDETKHLVGTTEEAPEYYRYWED